MAGELDDELTLGLDADSFREGLLSAAQQASIGGKKIEQSFHGATQHSEHLLSSSHRVARQIGNVSQSLVSGGGAADVFAAGLEGVEKSLHLPLGSLAGLAVVAVLADKIADAYNESVKLRYEIQAIISGDETTSGKFKSLEGLNSQLEELRKKSEELRKESQGIGDGVWSKFTDAVGMTSQFGRNQLQKKLSERGSEVMGNIANRATGRADIAEAGRSDGEFASERMKLEQEYREKREANVEKYWSGGDELHQIQEAEKKQYEISLAAIDKKEKSAAIQLSSERELLYLKEKGVDVEVRSAKAKLATAMELRDLATNGEEREKLDHGVKAAELEVQLATRTTREKREQLAMETKIEGLTGSEIEKRNAALNAQKEELARRRAYAKPDEIPGLNLEDAKLASQERALAQSQFEKGMSGLRARSASKTGRGADEKMAAAGRELGFLNLELEKAKRLYGDNSVEVDEQNAKLFEQQKRIEDIKFSQEQQLAAAKARTLEMDLEASGQTVAAKHAAIQAQYEAQILQAKRDQNSTLAEQLAKQEKISLIEQKVAEYLKSPAQKKAEADERRTHNLARRTVEARERQHADERARSNNGVGEARKVAETSAGANSSTDTLQQMNVETFHAKELHVDSIPSRGKK